VKRLLVFINKILIHLKKPSDKNSFKNVLVVSNTGLGDTILGTPAIKSLRKSFPKLHITFMINDKIYPLFEAFPYVDDFVMYKRGLINQLKIVSQLKKRKIDTIFLFHSNGPEDIFFSMLSGAKNILKMTDNPYHEYKKVFLNDITERYQHIIEKKIDLVKVFDPKIIDTTMEIAPKFYHKHKENNQTKILGLQIGAQDSYKIWPIEKFISLSNKLLEHYNIKIHIFGATQLEKELSQKLYENVNKKDNIKNLCCKSTIEQLPELIDELDLLITNDTGTFHLAVALKVPTVSLFGPTDHKIYGPYQDFDIHKVIQKDGFFVNDKPKKKRTQEGIDLIEVDEVYSKAETIMRELNND
jgi:ADP-heptose:LPS heptosyltransferase